jgi:hypothetical protein
MREGLEHKMTPPEKLIATEHLEKEASLEDEMAEMDSIIEKAETDVEEFVASGLPSAEKIAAETEDEVDPETKTALIELNRQAEIARQMLADSLVGKLRLKSADFLKKHIPNSRLTSLAEGKNAEIVSNRTAEKLREFLSFDGTDYKDADQAADYLEKHRELLVGEDREELESEVLEAVNVHEYIRAGILSNKTVAELRELLKYDFDKEDYKDADQAADYLEKHRELLVGEDRERLENEVSEVIKFHKQKEAELTSTKIIEELQEFLKEDDGDFKQAAKAVDYFLKHKDSINDSKKEKKI